jgi:5-hydroxyisourate hydrolase
MPRSPITTHVLDVARGRPAQGIPVMLEINETGGWWEIASATTDADGRVTNLLPEGWNLVKGTYRLTFDTARYQSETPSSAADSGGFYPFIPIVFIVHDPSQHYHVPLLLSPFGYSTYRGS